VGTVPVFAGAGAAMQVVRAGLDYLAAADATAMAAGEITESVARTLCLWTGKLPQGRREDADKILADAAVCGLGLADLAGLFAGIYQRYRAGEADQDKDESFQDRALRLVTTLGGAGVLHGDLSPECAGARCRRCWMPCRRPRTRRTPGRGSSGAMMRWARRCAN
jgi:hypothetical protein